MVCHLLPAASFPSFLLSDKFTKCVYGCDYLVRNTFQCLLHNTEGGPNTEGQKNKMKASAAKRIKYCKGSMTWGKLVFPPCPTFLLWWAGSERGMWVTVQDGVNIKTCFHIPVFLLPGELQLVNTGLASAMLLHSRRVQTSTCSSLERDRGAWPDLSEFLAPVQEDVSYLLLGSTVLSRFWDL